MTKVKYCLKCGSICSDKSNEYYRGYCTTCGSDFLEDDMTSLKYELLSENEKDEYEQQLMNKIKESSVFNEKIHNMYHKYKTHNFYYYFRFDKYEQMTGKRAGYKSTPEEDKQRKQYIEENYGKNSKAYQDAVVQNCINSAREREQTNGNLPKCPTCNSTNLKKISTTAKVTNTVMWGILGTKRYKTFHCNQCGYEW